MSTNTKIIIIGLSIGVIVGFTIARYYSPTIISPIPEGNPYITPPVRQCGDEFYYPDEARYGDPCPSPVVSPTIEKKKWIGKVSIYTRAGCLGCSESLTMANGEELKDEGLTIAFNRIPLNRKVRLTNVRTGRSVVAKVADRGGFEKYDRLADLTSAVASAIGAKTDTTDVRIEEL